MKSKKVKRRGIPEDPHPQQKKSASDSWLPEKNAASGFTLTGIVLFMMLIGLMYAIQYLFF